MPALKSRIKIQKFRLLFLLLLFIRNAEKIEEGIGASIQATEILINGFCCCCAGNAKCRRRPPLDFRPSLCRRTIGSRILSDCPTVIRRMDSLDFSSCGH
jgi:hypothetical protein